MPASPLKHTATPAVSTVVKTWDEAVTLGKELDGWLFRGQASARWSLTTSLERLAKESTLKLGDFYKREEQIFHRFRRQALHYLPNKPDDDDYLEWFSIIQHHGGPTRLLDFTRSFYTAAFFALESAIGPCAVWAVSKHELDKIFAAHAQFDIEAGHPPTMRESKSRVANRCIARYFGIDESPPNEQLEEGDQVIERANVIAVEPEQLNQRMITQQGVFLVPTIAHLGFERNLIGGFDLDLDVDSFMSIPDAEVRDLSRRLRKHNHGIRVLRIVLPMSVRESSLKDLLSMNIHAASLFPGLDGFARSLRSVFLSPAEAD